MIYAMNVGFLRKIEDIDKTIYDPVLNPVKTAGHPDHPSHSLVVFFPEFLHDQAKRPETILKLRDHAKI